MANDPKDDWGGARGEKWAARLTGMEGTLKPIDGPLIDALRLDAPVRVADVGCGGGGTSLEIFRHAPKGSVVHGYDLSPALVALARARVPAGETALTFDVADMTTAAPPPHLYDRVTSRFGTMFFAEPAVAFTNIARFLAPGGRFAFAVWGPVRDNPWMGIVRDAAQAIVEVPALELDAPGPFRYGDVAPLLRLLEGAGLAEISVGTWRGELPVGGGLGRDEAAAFAVESFGPFGELLASGADDAIARARAAVAARFTEHVKGGVVKVPASVHVVRGVRVR